MFSIPVFTVEQFALTIFYDKDMYGHKDTHTQTGQKNIRLDRQIQVQNKEIYTNDLMDAPRQA